VAPASAGRVLAGMVHGEKVTPQLVAQPIGERTTCPIFPALKRHSFHIAWLWTVRPISIDEVIVVAPAEKL